MMPNPNAQSVPLKSLLDECIALSRPSTRLAPSEAWFTASKEFRVTADQKRLKAILVKLLNHGIHAPEHCDIKVWISRSPVLTNGVRLGFRGGIPWPEVEQVLDQPGDHDWVRLEYESENNQLPGAAEESDRSGKPVSDQQHFHVLWMDLSLCTEHVEAMHHTGSTGKADHNLFRILYIEDNSANLSLVETALTHREYAQLLKASTGEEGIEIAAQQQPNLILLDINLPGIDGYEALYQLANNPSTKHIPVIAVSANAMGQDVERACKAGARDYLVKPYSIAKLFELIDHWSVFARQSGHSGTSPSAN